MSRLAGVHLLDAAVDVLSSLFVGGAYRKERRGSLVGQRLGCSQTSVRICVSTTFPGTQHSQGGVSQGYGFFGPFQRWCPSEEASIRRRQPSTLQLWLWFCGKASRRAGTYRSDGDCCRRLRGSSWHGGDSPLVASGIVQAQHLLATFFSLRGATRAGPIFGPLDVTPFSNQARRRQ